MKRKGGVGAIHELPLGAFVGSLFPAQRIGPQRKRLTFRDMPDLAGASPVPTPVGATRRVAHSIPFIILRSPFLKFLAPPNLLEGRRVPQKDD